MPVRHTLRRSSGTLVAWQGRRVRCVELNFNLDRSDGEAEARQRASRRTLACAWRASRRTARRLARRRWRARGDWQGTGGGRGAGGKAQVEGGRWRQGVGGGRAALRVQTWFTCYGYCSVKTMIQGMIIVASSTFSRYSSSNT
jgi:hypothetical protein